MKKFSTGLLCLIVTVFTVFTSQGQVIGGRENGEMTPGAAKASALSGGSLKGDVNPMTGEFSSSVALGSVATPGGLGYNLSLDYSSSFSISASQAMTSGIPYGEGWGPNLPTISVEVDAFHKFTCGDFNYAPGDKSVVYNDTSAYSGRNEGDLYWFAPVINIPGIASGRAVFKYIDNTDDKCLVFALNKFDTPVEIRFYGRKGWEIRIANGDTYTFSTQLESYAAADAQRLLNYNQSDVNDNNQQLSVATAANTSPYFPYAQFGDAVQNVIEPKRSFTVWYCNQIYNSNLPRQSINFEYKKYGAFNYFEEFNQEHYQAVRTHIFADDLKTDYTVYSDIHLLRVYSSVDASQVDIIELEYEIHTPAIDGQVILSQNQTGVYAYDELYNYSVVESWGVNGANTFNGWKRYKHAAAQNGMIGQGEVGRWNPYLKNGNYTAEMVGNVSDAEFDHGFLESNRFMQSGGYVPGDIYEIRTTVSRDTATSLVAGNGTIDIALKTGRNGNFAGSTTNGSYPSEPLTMSDSEFEQRKGIEIFSTFNSPVKWQMGHGQGTVNTSNYFVMPNVPSNYFGFNLQVGPGNSDIDFGTDPLENFDMNTGSPLDVREAYPYTWNGPKKVRSTDRIAHKFGTGHPWAMMIPVYNEMALHKTDINGSAALPEDLYKHWWATTAAQNQVPAQLNVPTKFDQTVQLEKVELVRYSKNGLMLNAVKTYKISGEYRGLQDTTKQAWNLVSQKKMDYQVHSEPLLRNFDYDQGDLLEIEPGLNRRVILLNTVSEVPLNGDLAQNDFGLADPTQVLTTTLEYDKYLDGANTNNSSYNDTTLTAPYIEGMNQYVLSAYTDALGGITRVAYYPILDPATRMNSTFRRSECAYSARARVTAAFGRDHSYTVHPAVRFLAKNDEGDQLLTTSNMLVGGSVNPELKVWEYVYNTNTLMRVPKKLTVPEKHFSGNYFNGYELAFKNVTIYEPYVNSGATGRNYTEYEYFGNKQSEGVITESEYLYYGKPKHIKRFSFNGQLEEETFFEYDHTLAFENGYLRPNPLREHLWNEHPVVQQYEYQDIQEKDTLTLNSVIYEYDMVNEQWAIVDSTVYLDLKGKEAYSYLDIPYANGKYTSYEMPKLMSFYFYDLLIQNNDTFQLNSYFIKKTAETHRIYEDGLSKGAVTNSPSISVNEMPPNDSFGSGYVNPTADNPVKDAVFISLIDPSDEAGMLDKLLDATPVSDAILIALVQSSVTGGAKFKVLNAQGDLSDAVWSEIWSNLGRLSSADVAILAQNQSYISDRVILEMFGVLTRRSNAAMIERVLLKNPYLSGQVINDLISTNNQVSGASFATVMAAQPQLPELDLIQILDATKTYSGNVHTVLSNQFVTDAIYQHLLQSPKFGTEHITKVIENNAHFPEDQTLMGIIGHTPAFTHNQLKRIFGQADRSVGHLVLNALTFNVGPVPADDIFMGVETNNSLTQYCASSIDTSRTYIETKTRYEYYEADHKGNALGVAYELLLGMREKFESESKLPYIAIHQNAPKSVVVSNLKLKHEPSWMLFSTTVSSAHLQGAYAREEYFYNYDLRNRYDRHWYNYDFDNADANYTPVSGTVGPHTRVLVSNDLWDGYYNSGLYGVPEIPQFDAMSRTQELGNRSLAFQKTSISKNTRDAAPKYASEYYFYNKGWVVPGYPGDAASVQFSAQDCPQAAPSSNGPCTEYTDCNDCYQVFYKPFMNWEEIVPMGWCSWHITGLGYIVCPQGHNPADDLVGEQVSLEYCASYPSISANIPYAQTFEDMVQLRSVFVQVDDKDHSTAQEFAGKKLDTKNTYIAEFYMGNPNAQSVAHGMILPSDHLKVREVKQRNRFTQVALEENAAGLQTKYFYKRTKYIWNYDPNCPILNYNSSLNEDIGLPIRVEVGHTREDSLVTYFEYTPIGLVRKTTDPNGKTMEYTFDDYHRLKTVTENATRLLTEYDYHSWDLNPLASFDQRTNGNYVWTKNYSNNDLSFYEHAKAFVDPLGRNQGTALSYTSDGLNHKTIHSGYVNYDNLGRVVSTEKTYTSLFVAPTLNTPSLPMAQPFGGVVEQVLFEAGYKGRAKRSANFGVDVDGVHAIKTHYAIANNIYASCELDLSLSELYQIMRAGGTGNVRLFRTEIYDQDDKRTVSYKNALGQNVASLKYNNNNEKLVTLFVYDSYGNLTKTINPEKQQSDYVYNRLGQLIIENTVDAGKKHFMYNKQGLLSVILDQQGSAHTNGVNADPFYRVMEYDMYGRLLKQGLSDISAEKHSFLYNNELYGPLHYKTDTIWTDSVTAIWDPVSQAMRYFLYEFSDAQTQDYLYCYKYQNGSNIAITSGLDPGEMDVDLREKTVGYGIQQGTYELGRVTRTTSYNTIDKPIQSVRFTYDALGYIKSQEVDFSKTELYQSASNQYDVSSKIEYPAYNYRGSLLEEKVDVDNDGTVDFQCFMQYDPLNRLTGIYGATGDVGAIDNATLLVSYQYDDVSGKMKKREHFVWDGQNALHALVNQISYDYDQRDRLTNITSGLMSFGEAPMFDYEMLYDDQLVDFDDGTYTSSVTHTTNWNGNVNGIKAGYDFTGSNILNNVQGFDGPTVYGYSYDAINRLIYADGTVSDLLDAQNLNDSYQIGDVSIVYDRIGNIQSLRRALRNSDNTQGAPYTRIQGFNYMYANDKNQLLSAVGMNANTQTRSYTYDAIGNLLTDSYRKITGTEYTRGAYAAQLTIDPDGVPQNADDQSVWYLYSSNDLRIYKKHVTSNQTLEDYYLMDASGRTVAILKQGYPSQGWEYYVNGVERELRITPNPTQLPGSNVSATTADKRIVPGRAVYYATDHLGNTRITYAPSQVVNAPGRIVYQQDFETNNAPGGWVAGDGQFSSASQNALVFTTNVNATSQNVSYVLNSSLMTIGDNYLLSLDVNTGNAPAVNATILGTDLLNVDLSNGYNEIPFTYTGGLPPVLYLAVTNGNGQAQQYTFSLDNIFVGTVAGDYTLNKIEYVADYFPYGKILREFVESDKERFLTTQHERDAETGLDYRGARYYDSDIARFLSLDPKGSEFPEWSDYNYVIGNPIIFIDPDGKKPTPKEAALMAKHVYGGMSDDKLQGGWTVSSIAMTGLADNKNGYKTQIYERSTNDGAIEYAYVYAGTEDGDDWDDNFSAPLGTSYQYDSAISDAVAVDKAVGESELTFVGHSLGGGMSNASALKTGRESIGFNPAWVSHANIAKHALDEGNADGITNYVILGEILDTSQELIKTAAKKTGETRYLSPKVEWVFFGPTIDPVNNHSIETVLEQLEKYPSYNKVSD